MSFSPTVEIEPLPLPEPVRVSDPDTLVPQDHPARSSHQVIVE
ncbi:hypothetical protein [Rhodoplanes sp. SY1]